MESTRKPELTIIIPPPVDISEQSSAEEETNCSTVSNALIPCTIGVIILGLTSGVVYFIIAISTVKWAMFQH